MPSDSDGARTKLGNASMVSVGLLVGILGAAIYATALVARASERIDILTQQGAAKAVQDATRDKAIADLAEAMRTLSVSVAKMGDAVDLRLWIADLGRRNPTMDIPQFGGPFDGRGPHK